MHKTWASGSIELLGHALEHMRRQSAFDRRIAFISVDNCVEVSIRTYLTLPKQFYGDEKPSRKEIEDNYNSFTGLIALLFKYSSSRLIGVEPGDIEFYHRIRNKLYHEAIGLSVDYEQLLAYFSIAEILVKRLFNYSIFRERERKSFLENIILNWNRIEEVMAEILERLQISKSDSRKWEKAIELGILTPEIINEIASLRFERNELVHSDEIENKTLKEVFEKSVHVLETLNKLVEINRSKIYRNEDFYYGPKESTLYGEIKCEIGYGPPDFGEPPDKDAQYTYYVLYLNDAINVLSESTDWELADIEKNQLNINKIQLMGSESNDLKHLVNKKVVVRGTLSGAHTLYHHTPVLMSVKEIEIEN
jgi:uncharacterized protein YutE (UPF0331/DUF86 family)